MNLLSGGSWDGAANAAAGPRRDPGGAELGSVLWHAAVTALDRLRLGLIVVAADHAVLSTNRYARDLLQARDGLQLTRHGLAALTADDTRRLRAVLVAGSTSTSIAHLSRRAGKRPLSLLACPAAPTQHLPGPAVILFVSDPDQPRNVDAERVAQLHGLTPAEGRLAAHLVQGATLDEAARQMGVALTTVRTHLKRTFEKTGTKRQAELVKLLTNGLFQVCDN